MLKTKLFAALAAIVLTMFALPASASASVDTLTGMATASVEYRGSVTTLAALEQELGETHCHDAKGQGQLTCFATEAEADLDLLNQGGLPAEAAKTVARKLGVAVPKQARSAAAGCHPWVTMRFYDGNSGTGSSVAMYCDYPNLGDVGWNNKANSVICYVCPPLVGTSPYGVEMARFYNDINYYNLNATTFNTVLRNIGNGLTSSSRIVF
ncbi:hypothetical protein ACFQ61_04880 [Streptomyces sp. NPDC056500]|uniref:hypothetical protein n=1 Tax=Streptomyces sp. NPDC056500 TaxID=3345840 RepID=UPI00369F97FE